MAPYSVLLYINVLNTLVAKIPLLSLHDEIMKRKYRTCPQIALHSATFAAKDVAKVVVHSHISDLIWAPTHTDEKEVKTCYFSLFTKPPKLADVGRDTASGN